MNDVEPAMRTGATALSGSAPAKLIVEELQILTNERGVATLC